MGNIIKFDKGTRTNILKNGKSKLKKKVSAIIVIISTVCGITGFTILNLYDLFFAKDWQAIAEKYNNEGLELYNSGEYQEAIEMYNKAIELEEKKIENVDICYFNRGLAYYKLGDYGKSIGDYSIAIAINPRAKYYSQRALAYKMIGDEANETLDNIRALTSLIE